MSEEQGERLHQDIKVMEEKVSTSMGYSYDGRLLLVFGTRLL